MKVLNSKVKPKAIKTVKQKTAANVGAAEGEEKYRLLYETSRDAIMILEPPAWNFTAGNPATLAMFGAKTEKEFIAKSPGELSPEKQPDGQISMEKVGKKIEETLEKGYGFFEWTHRRLNGEDFPSTVLLTKFKLNGHDALHATLRDISVEKEAEEKFKNIFNNTNENYILVDDEYRINDINDTGVKTLGYSKKDILGKSIQDLHSEEYRSKCLKNIESVLRGESVVCDCPYVRPDKKIVYADSILSVIKIAGKIYVLIAFRDVSTVRQKEEEYKNILATAMDGFYIVDEKARIMDVNDAYCAMIGYSREELLKMSIMDVEAIDKEIDVKNRVQKIMRTGSDRFESKHRCKDGKIIDVEASVRYLKEGEIVKFVVFMRDITDREKVEKELKLFSAAISNSISAVAILGMDGKHIYVNSSWEKAMGYSLEEARKLNIPEFVAKEETKRIEKEIMPSVMKGGCVGELITLKKDGTKFPVLFTASLVKGDDNAPVAILVSFLDITERKTMEKEMKEKIFKLESMSIVNEKRYKKLIEQQVEIIRLKKRLGEETESVIGNQ